MIPPTETQISTGSQCAGRKLKIASAPAAIEMVMVRT